MPYTLATDASCVHDVKDTACQTLIGGAHITVSVTFKGQQLANKTLT